MDDPQDKVAELAASDATKRRHDRIMLGATVAAAVFGLISIVVAVWVAWVADKQAALTLVSGVSRALVSIERRNNEAITVRYRGVEVASPWLVSLRLENTGNLPIGRLRDPQHEPVRIGFGTARPVWVGITDRSPRQTVALVEPTPAGVELEFNLLNPGDWIAVEALFDGPAEVTSFEFRMEGAVSLLRRTEEARVAADVTLPLMARPLQFVALVCATVAALICWMLVIVGVRQAWDEAASGVGSSAGDRERLQRLFGVRSVNDLAGSPFSRWGAGDAARLLAILGTEADPAWLENRAALVAAMSSLLTPEMQVAIGMDADSAAEVILQSMRRERLSFLSSHAYMALPVGPDIQARDEINKLDPTLPDAKLLRQAQAIVDAKLREWPAPPSRRLTREGVVFALMAAVFVVISLGATFVVAGAWRSAGMV